MLNAVIREARERPIVPMFEDIRHKVIEWYDKRRKIDADVPPEQIIVSSAVNEIKKLTAWQARRYRLLPCSDTVVEVFSLERRLTYTVQLMEMTCTCLKWQSTGIPCAHAIAVILGRKEDPQCYLCSAIFIVGFIPEILC